MISAEGREEAVSAATANDQLGDERNFNGQRLKEEKEQGTTDLSHGLCVYCVCTVSDSKSV